MHPGFVRTWWVWGSKRRCWYCMISQCYRSKVELQLHLCVPQNHMANKPTVQYQKQIKKHSFFLLLPLQTHPPSQTSQPALKQKHHPPQPKKRRARNKSAISPPPASSLSKRNCPTTTVQKSEWWQRDLRKSSTSKPALKWLIPLANRRVKGESTWVFWGRG